MRTFILLSISLIMLTDLSAQADKKQSKKHFWNTVETTASPEAIWQIWIDVPNWKNWDSGLKDATIFGDFALDSKGQIISLEGRKSKFKVVELEEGRSYTFKTKLPLGGLYVKRTLEQKDDKTYFTHEVWFKGLTAGIFANMFGNDFREMLPGVMGNIKNIAEK